jgi:hypothetical protein
MYLVCKKLHMINLVAILWPAIGETVMHKRPDHRSDQCY